MKSILIEFHKYAGFHVEKVDGMWGYVLGFVSVVVARDSLLKVITSFLTYLKPGGRDA